MKRVGIAIGLGLISMTSTAFAADPGPYVSVGASVHLPEATAFAYEQPPGTKTGQSRADYSMGYGLALAAGYRWSESMRLELEVGMRHAGVDDVGPETASGHQTAISGMVNVLFDVGIAQGIYPYVGGGVGLASNRWKNVQTATSPVWSDNDTKMQWQAIVGAELPINDRTAWFIDYRYIGSTDNEYQSVPSGARVVGVDNMSHNVLVGVRYSFGK